MNKKHLLTICCMLFVSLLTSCGTVARPEGPAYDLAYRLLGDDADNFIFKDIASEEGVELFEISSEGDKVVISANSELTKATGLNYYLENLCNCLVSLDYNQLSIPEELPLPKETIRVSTPFKYRYFFNYCTFGYTMTWWGWDRWEKMTDYMALKGVNMPLAIIGQEAVWDAVYKDMGLTQEDMDGFFVGPSHLPWGWLGNIDGMAGPLPKDWITRRADLQKKVLERQRSLGMKPVLPAFTGHVPKNLSTKYPEAKIMQIAPWAGVEGTHFLDPTDPLFTEIGSKFIEKQTEMYGTDHFYSADCFIEVDPPSNDPKFLKQTASTVYNSMAKVDNEAVWVLQGWFFFFRESFWQKEQGEAFCNGIPKDKVIVLDLYGEKNPTWDKTDSFFGQPWIWNVICNEDQKVNMSGDLRAMQKEFNRALKSELKNNLQGIGVIPEGFGYNSIVQDFVFNKAWNQDSVDVAQWVRQYASRRYNTQNPKALQAWEDLSNSVYGRTRVMWSPLITTPQMTKFSGSKEDIRHNRVEYIITDEDPFAWDFNVFTLSDAANNLLSCASELKDSETYRFDLTNVTRELLCSLTHKYIHELTIAYEAKDMAAIEKAENNILTLFDDLDEITGCNEKFMLGSWLNDAIAWGGDNVEDQNYYNCNARTIVTIWQPYEHGALRDYAGRSWNGLLKDYYKPRWALYCNMLKEAVKNGKELDRKAFDKAVRKIDYQWTLDTKTYPDEPTGDVVEVATRIINDYSSLFKH